MHILKTQIQSVDTQTCLVANDDKHEAVLYKCEENAANQLFILTEQNEIRNNDLCMDAISGNASVKSLQCHTMGGNQEWVYDHEVSLIRLFDRHSIKMFGVFSGRK